MFQEHGWSQRWEDKGRGDSRPAVNLTTVSEVNLVIEALQDKLGSIYRAEIELRKRSETLSRDMHEKGLKISRLLDKMRVGWKRAAEIPEELLRKTEDRRFWTTDHSDVRLSAKCHDVKVSWGWGDPRYSTDPYEWW